MQKARLLLASVAAIMVAAPAYADISVKIGVMNDRSGTYADLSGEGSVVAARMAVEDFGAVERASTSPSSRPTTRTSRTSPPTWPASGTTPRRRRDRRRADLLGGPGGQRHHREKNKVFLVSGAATSDLTGPACSPNTVHWTYDTWSLAHGTGQAMVETGGDSWFFLTADYAFGHALERDTTAVVEASGGKVLGSPCATPSRARTSPPSCCRPRPPAPR
jgi:branched-chain amino acid transport system substrate-binding protein